MRVVRRAGRYQMRRVVGALDTRGPAKQTVHSGCMPPLSASTWNATFIHDPRDFLEGQMPTKLGKYQSKLPG